MIPTRDQVQAVCDGLRNTFPNADTDPPRVPEAYFDNEPDVATIKSEHFGLKISEECFDYHKPDNIVEALVSLGYSKLLAKHRHLLTGCAPHRARSDLSLVANWKDWYLLAEPN